MKIGQKMRCKITGFEGIATSKIEYLNGCIQYCIKPKMDKDGKMPEGEFIDVEQLEVIYKLPVKTERTNTGGDKMDTPNG